MDNLLFLRMGITSGISFVLTGCVWWYAKKFGLLIDIPDSRSSHDTPIYRGGGIALFLAFLLSYFLMQWPALPHDFLYSFIFFSGGTAFVGWMDDHCSLSPVLRFFSYVCLSMGAVILMGPIQTISIGHSTLSLGFWSTPLTALGVLWMLNLYNFMDGIDGQATLTGLFVTGAILLMMACGLIKPCTETVVCSMLFPIFLGFLLWNFPPARIFLGDSGSCFIGFSFGLLLILSTHRTVFLWTWLILFTHFITDTSLTLLLRMLRRELWTQPHRQHLFQRALQVYEKKQIDRTYSHRKVNQWFQGCNVFLVLPFALLAQAHPLHAPYLFVTLSLCYGGVLIWLDLHEKCM